MGILFLDFAFCFVHIFWFLIRTFQRSFLKGMAELTHCIKLLVIAHKPSFNICIILRERLYVYVYIYIYIFNTQPKYGYLSVFKILLFSKTNRLLFERCWTNKDM